MSRAAAAGRVQTLGEEIANSVSHGAGLLLALAAAPLLVWHAATGGAARVFGAAVFAATLVLLYLGSTLYHALPPGKAKRVFQVLEHSAIYLLIAGTYTPFTLGVLRGPYGWTLFALVWALAAAGVGLKLFGGAEAYPAVSLLLYLFMGWIALAAVRPLWLNMPHAGFFCLVLGGLAYTAGVPFFVAERLPYGHLVWHLFVMTGSALHYVAAFKYAR